jgi:hypothetical protein
MVLLLLDWYKDVIHSVGENKEKLTFSFVFVHILKSVIWFYECAFLNWMGDTNIFR